MEINGGNNMYASNMILTRIALYATLGLLLSSLNITTDNIGFWAVLSLLLCSDYVARYEGHQLGFVHGIHSYLNMNDAEKEDMLKIIKDLDK